MKIIDGKDCVLGRVASYVAKEALKGEEIVIVNCEEMIISGSKVRIKKDFEEKRGRVGHSQKGPKHHKTSEKIVKRSIRGMLPDHRMGRGKKAFERIKCYKGVPEEFKDKEFLVVAKENKFKASKVREFTK